MTCPACGTENPTTNRFCWGCGRSLDVTCAACGTSNPPDTRFCGTCGTALRAAGVPDPERHASDEAEPVAERRLITVLFADLANYTSFSEGRDPEDVRAFLSTYFERCSEVIGRFGGVVEKFIGDAVMAVWGATTAHEDDSERAVRAGLELVDAVAKLSADAGAGLALRVGIHTGGAAVGSGGDGMGMVAGDNVNTAARLQTAAAPGTVLVGEGTYQAAASSIEFVPAGEHRVKGKRDPVTAYRARRVVAERGGAGRSQGLEPPFVGRREELGLLKDMLASVGRDARARIVPIVGESGIGKSRLVWEFQKYIDGLVEDVFWHEGRSPAYGEGVTFWAVAEMIRARAGIDETDSQDAAHRKLTRAIDEHLPDPVDRDWVTPRLAAVLGVGVAPDGERSELDAAVRAFFEGVSRGGTVVLVFEDVQWADTALLDFIEELPDWWAGRPMLVVTVARPDLIDRRPAWGADRPGTISMRLGPLTRSEMGELVTGTTPGLPPDAVEAVIDKAAGIPLYAVELLRMLIARGDLVTTDQGFELIGDLADHTVPDSLQAVIGARLDRLSRAERSLLQDAAVLGQTFSVDGLAAIDPAGGDTHPTLLASLVKSELVEPVRDPRSPEHGRYRFIQALIRDVALGRMGREARRARHLEVASWFEELADPEMAVVVASHYLEALDATPPGPGADEIRAKALASMTAAADRAAELRAHDQVMSIANQSLALADTPDLRAPIWERMAEVGDKLALREEAARYARLALDHYGQVGDTHGVNRVVRQLAVIYVKASRAQEAIPLLEEHLATKPDVDDRALIETESAYARVLLVVDRDEEAFEAADRAMCAAERAGLTDAVVEAITTKATARSSGRLVESRILIEGAIALADSHQLTWSAVRARNNLAHLIGGIDPRAAVGALLQAFEQCKRAGDRGFALFVGVGLSFIWQRMLALDEIERLELEPVLSSPGSVPAAAFIESHALVKWLRGDHHGAIEDYSEAARLLEGEEDSQLSAGRANDLAIVERLRGNAAEAFDSAVEWGRRGWSLFLGVDNALWALVMLADRSRVAELHEVMERYDRQILALPRILRCIVDTDPGASLPADEIDTMIDLLDTNLVRLWAIQALVLAARFSPPGDTDGGRWLAEARRRAQDGGYTGILDFVDLHVPVRSGGEPA